MNSCKTIWQRTVLFGLLWSLVSWNSISFATEDQKVGSVEIGRKGVCRNSKAPAGEVGQVVIVAQKDKDDEEKLKYKVELKKNNGKSNNIGDSSVYRSGDCHLEQASGNKAYLCQFKSKKDGMMVLMIEKEKSGYHLSWQTVKPTRSSFKNETKDLGESFSCNNLDRVIGSEETPDTEESSEPDVSETEAGITPEEELGDVDVPRRTSVSEILEIAKNLRAKYGRPVNSGAESELDTNGDAEVLKNINPGDMGSPDSLVEEEKENRPNTSLENFPNTDPYGTVYINPQATFNKDEPINTEEENVGVE